MIATIGRRYRSLITRYMDEPETSTPSRSRVSTPIHFEAKSSKTAAIDVDNHIHCLLWRAENWT